MSLVPTSVREYQPEKGAHGNWIPPTSNRQHETAGRANHCRFKLANSGILRTKHIIGTVHVYYQDDSYFFLRWMCDLDNLDDFLRYLKELRLPIPAADHQWEDIEHSRLSLLPAKAKTKLRKNRKYNLFLYK